MKKLYITIILVCVLLKPIQSYSQGADDIAVAVGGLLAIGGAIGSVGAAEEQLELKATEWVLSNMDMKKFNLEMIPFESSFIGIQKSGSYSYSAVKTQFRNSLQLGGHLSGAVPFKLYEFEINDLPNGKFDFTIVNRYILMMYSFPGFITDRGINYTDVIYELIDKELWLKRTSEYVKSISNTELDIISSLKSGIILNKGIANGQSDSNRSNPFGDNYVGKELKIRFYKLDGNSYIVSDYTDEFKYIYNEKSLGMFHKSTKRLFQLEAKSIREIHGFLKRKTPITLKN